MKGTYIIICSGSATNLVSALKLSMVIEIFWECDIPSPVLKNNCSSDLSLKLIKYVKLPQQAKGANLAQT